MSLRTGWIAGAMVLGAIALVVLVRPVPPADSPTTASALPEPAAAPESPTRGTDVAEEVVAPEPPSREPPPLPALAPPSEVGEASRLLARSMPADSPGVAPTVAFKTTGEGPPVFANFAAEPIDPEWAPRAQTDIVSRFAEQPGLELIALQVECRTTMCQVQMTQPSSAVDEPMRLLNSSGMQTVLVMSLKSQPSMQNTVAILSRPGHGPPDMRQLVADPLQPAETGTRTE